MPDCENPAVKSVQTPCIDGMGDGTSRVAEGPSQLPNRDNAMLPLGEIRKTLMFRRVCLPFVAHSEQKVRRTSISPLPSRYFIPRLRSEREKAAGPWAGGFV
jgi:hypothetical protein